MGIPMMIPKMRATAPTNNGFLKRSSNREDMDGNSFEGSA
jgi:hypothetical protein